MQNVCSKLSRPSKFLALLRTGNTNRQDILAIKEVVLSDGDAAGSVGQPRKHIRLASKDGSTNRVWAMSHKSFNQTVWIAPATALILKKGYKYDYPVC